MNVLSLFDGISCGQVALQRAGIKYDNYYASEIDKYAIEITQKNFPNTIQLGDIRNWKKWKLPKIDLILAGSPCQGFSFAGKQLNFNDPRSKLFFEFEAILDKLNPDFFLLENVRMKQEYQDIISWRLDVDPIEINSSLVSAQNRKRLYWTNIPGVTQPEDKGILLKDIVHENTGDLIDLDEYLVPFSKTLQVLDKEVERGKVGYFKQDSQANRVYYIHGKAVTLCGEAGGGAAKMGQYLFGGIKQRGRGYNKGNVHVEKSPTVTSSRWEQNNHIFGCITPDRINKRQNGQRFNEGKKFYTLTAQDKHGILIEGYIRKLTPIEGERLQTLPDNYTAGVSNSQRYKSLGNGWTVDVVAHILSFMDPKEIITNDRIWE